MARHILRMIWNRKRANGLLLLEMLVSSIVLYLVLAQGLHAYGKFVKPLGFSWGNVYMIHVNPGNAGNAVDNTRLNEALEQLEAITTVESASAMMPGPFRNSTWRTTFGREPGAFATNIHMARTDLAETLGIHVSQGRWPGEEDLGGAYRPIVVSEQFLLDYFPGEEGRAMVEGRVDPIGRRVDEEREHDPLEIIGVVPIFRPKGDLMQERALYFHTVSESDTSRLLSSILLRVAPGTSPGAFEEEAVRRIQAIAPDWSLRMDKLDDLRMDMLRERALPLGIAGLVVVFLLLMTALGLIGVLWQNVTRRRPEIGLRRALGAGRREIFLQLLGEIAILSLLALAGAWLIVLQLPVLGLEGGIGWNTLLTALGMTSVAILLLSLLAGLYPGWLSSRILPSQALHYE